MNYRELLKKYIAHVIETDPNNDSGLGMPGIPGEFEPEEWSELQRLQEELPR